MLNEKATLFQEYLIACGMMDKAYLECSSDHAVHFIYGVIINDWYCNVSTYIPEGEIIKIHIYLRKFVENEFQEPIYEACNDLNAISGFICFFAQNGVVSAGFPYFVANASLFYPSLITGVVENVIKFIEKEAYHKINNAIHLSEEFAQLNNNTHFVPDKRSYEQEKGDIDRNYDLDDCESGRSEYNRLLEKNGYDEDSMESDPDYWDYLYSKSDV